MAFFSSKNQNQNTEILQRTQENLTITQENIRITQENIHRMASLYEEKQIVKHYKDYDEEAKQKAAYALNLCTVSLSQIIEYNDIYVLEQEYEAILNNLNLENIPKDEALLDILKQILDTITFFKIQEGDKAFIEKEYRHKMKNAIWESVPNFGIIFAGGDLKTMALSLASQVGIGYMNYRKEKANNDLEKERKEWELLRSAMEQFNGLRRELFTTAWRLADEYSFPDEYRLTEKQITQYNAILMDSNVIRRYERLDSIKCKFRAYPPFWYYFGHSANVIANNEEDINSIIKFKELAKTHFSMFMECNKHNLLREDKFASSCALEYIELLDQIEDRIEIEKMIDLAVDKSGDACDILEIAALSYLKVKNFNKAKSILKYLVNEDYNTVLNAQLLSRLLVEDMIKSKCMDSKNDYDILLRKIDSKYLFPLPDFELSKSELEIEFYNTQKKMLMQKYFLVLDAFRVKYQIEFNKVLPIVSDRVYADDYFIDDNGHRERRIRDYSAFIINDKGFNRYINELKMHNVPYSYLQVINKMFGSLLELEILNCRQELSEQISQSIELYRNEFEFFANLDRYENKEKLENLYADKFIKELFSISFDDLTGAFFFEIYNNLGNYISLPNDNLSLNKIESNLRSFCNNNDIVEPEVILDIFEINEVEESTKTEIFTMDLLGDGIRNHMRHTEKKQKMIDVLLSYEDNLVKDNRKQERIFYRNSEYFTKIVNENKSLKNEHTLKANIFSLIEFRRKEYLFLTPENIGYFNNNFSQNNKRNLRISKYRNITLSRNNVLNISDKDVESDFMNFDELYSLIQKYSSFQDESNDSVESLHRVSDIQDSVIRGMLTAQGMLVTGSFILNNIIKKR